MIDHFIEIIEEQDKEPNIVIRWSFIIAFYMIWVWVMLGMFILYPYWKE